MRADALWRLRRAAQGVGDFYTDPQIHTWDGDGFGMGNLGAEGIERYLASCGAAHAHNALIGKLGLLRLEDPQHGARHDPRHGARRRADEGGGDGVVRALVEDEQMSRCVARGGLEASCADLERV